MEKGSYVSVITLNVNGLKATIKRHRLADWIQKHISYIRFLIQTHLNTRDSYRLKLKGWKKVSHPNRDQRKQKQWYSYQIKQNLNEGCGKRQRRAPIIIKGSIQEEDITNINIYAPIKGALQYVRQMLKSMKGEISNNNNSGRL